MDLRTAQAPIKDRYREEPGEARITLVARASETDTPVAYCTVLQTLREPPPIATAD